MRARFVNEEVVATFGGRSATVTIYKNPPSVRRTPPWARAISDLEGNFYIADDESNEDYDSIYTTHIDMIGILNDKIPGFKME